MNSQIPEIEVEQLRDMLAQEKKPFILDVREKWENELCQIPRSELITLSALPSNFMNLPRDQTLVVHCHHGGRSAQAVMFLRQQGFDKVFNLRGGIQAWSERIDPKVKTYQ